MQKDPWSFKWRVRVDSNDSGQKSSTSEFDSPDILAVGFCRSSTSSAFGPAGNLIPNL